MCGALICILPYIFMAHSIGRKSASSLPYTNWNICIINNSLKNKIK
jgi:hypothetical protein